MANTSVSLGEHFTQFIESQIAGGYYGSASEVMRAGLRLLEEREAKLIWLRAELKKGEESGESQPLDWNEIRANLHARAQKAQ